MSPREDEHYQIGRSFGPNRPFSGSEFRDRYRQQFPNRKPGSIMPHEFCGNRHVATATAGPKFLIQLAPGRYEFVDHPEPAVALKLTSALSPRVSLSTVAKTEDRGASVKASAMRTIGEKAACGVRFKAKYLLADGDPSDPLVRVGPVASGVVAKRSEIERDWWTAILFFLSKAFYRGGRRDVQSENFYGRARLVLEANRRQLKPRFDPAELDRLLWEAAVNFHMDRRLVIGAFELLFDRRDIPDSNIVNYTLAHIRSGKTPDVYHHLQEIYGIGRKIASLWLRDVVMIWELESYLKNRIDLFCCQPIDTWIRQITTEMNIAPNKTPDKIRAMRIIAACEAENVSPLLFNAGAWMSGSEGSVSRR